MEPADKLGRLLREYLHRHQLLYKIALVPFSWYETILFFMHVSSQGLWASMLRSRRERARRANQREIKWSVPFPPYDEPAQLIRWLRSQGIKVSEGGHTFYLPPQENLGGFIPEIAISTPPALALRSSRISVIRGKLRIWLKSARRSLSLTDWSERLRINWSWQITYTHWT